MKKTVIGKPTNAAYADLTNINDAGTYVYVMYDAAGKSRWIKWTQTSHPVDTTVVGYKFLGKSGDDVDASNFGGFRNPSYSQTYITGDTSAATWMYAAATIAPNQGGIPSDTAASSKIKVFYKPIVDTDAKDLPDMATA